MKIALVTPTPPDISAFGVRSLSAYLRSKGHETDLVFLPGSIGLLKEGGDFAYHYSDSVVEQVVEICKDADLIGVSFMTSYFDRAIQITEQIRKRLDTKPIIWGGIHASCKPEEALNYADLVCVGEGEESLYEVVEKMRLGEDYTAVTGIWSKKNGQTVTSPVRPLIADLDSLPHFDFSCERHYVYDIHSDSIIPLTPEVLSRTLPLLPYFGAHLKRAFRTMTDRGCPHRCSYCNVSNLKRMYNESKVPYFRARSIPNVIEELENIKKTYPFIEVIQFFDDTFFARPPKQIAEFAALYKARVGLPFYCQASPTTLTEEKLTALLDAGLVYVELGIQTGSLKVKKLYHRQESNEKIIEVTSLLHKYRDRLMTPDYHIILDNPWETEDDTMDTVRLLYQVPKPYGLCLSSLIFFPQTELYEKALAEGLLRDETKEIYRKPFYLPPKRTYPNFLIYLFTFQHIPRFVLRALMSASAVRLFTALNPVFLYKGVYVAGEAMRLLSKGLSAFFAGDFKRIARYIKALIARDPVVAGRKG